MKNKVKFLAFFSLALVATSLQAQVNVGATAAPTGNTMLQVTAAGAKSGLAVGYAATAPTDGAIIKGNVGIGTAAPQQRLDVFGGSQAQFVGQAVATPIPIMRLQREGGAGQSFNPMVDIELGKSTLGGTPNLNSKTTLNFKLAGETFQVPNVNVMTLAAADDLAKVGIGTTSPNTALDVRGNTLFSNADAAGLAQINSGGITSNVTHIYSATAATTAIEVPVTSLRVGRPGTASARWSPTADFQIGTYAVSSGAAPAAATKLNIRLGNGNTPVPEIDVMTLQANGYVGIGTTSPTSVLQVVGLPTHADNAAATTAGLTVGAFYKTATGVLMVRF